MELPNCTPWQHGLSDQLSEYSDLVRTSYLGALYVLQQKEYPDKFVHFAQSLREVVDQLARCKEDSKCNRQTIKARKECLQKTFDLEERPSVDHLFDMLASTYDRLSRVDHHREKISDAQAQDIMSKVEEALHRSINFPRALDPELVNVMMGRQSPDSAKRLAGLLRQTDGSPLIDSVQHDWLSHLKEAGFFENPPPASDDQSGNYKRWAPAIYLEICAQTSAKYAVADIIASCALPDRPNIAVYTDFLRCAAVLPPAGMEKVGRKALDENWDRFMRQDQFRANYITVAEKLIQNHKYDVATSMLRRALKPKPSEPRHATGTGGSATDHSEPVDPFMFQKLLGKMPNQAKTKPAPIIKLLTVLLDESIMLGKGGKAGENRRRKCRFPDAGEIGQSGMAEITSSLSRCIKVCVAAIADDLSKR